MEDSELRARAQAISDKHQAEQLGDGERTWRDRCISLSRDYERLVEENRVLKKSAQTYADLAVDAMRIERERCLKIARGAMCVFDGPEVRVEGFSLAKDSIAAEIEEGK